MNDTHRTEHSAPHRRHPLPPAGHVTPADTLKWIAAGWETFIANPGIWIIQTLVLIAVLFVLAAAVGFIPHVGPLLAPLVLQLVFPMFVAGMVAGVQAQREGEPLRVGHLFEGARRHAGNLLMVGFFFVLGGLAAALVAVLVGSSAAVTGTLVGLLGSIGLANGAALLSAALWPILLILLLMALWYAPSLVVLQNVSPLDAMKLSLRACIANLASFMILGFVVYLLSWFAMLPFALGVLVLVPVLAGALYAAWESTFAQTPALLSGPDQAEADPGNGS